MKISFMIPGEPKGKGRPRFVNNRGFKKAITPDETVIYENLVVMTYKEKYKDYMFKDGPLKMVINAYYSIPKSMTKKKKKEIAENKLFPTKKPDIDNIFKIIADSLNNIAYKDDSQIVKAEVQKYYGEIPYVQVIIEEIKEE